MRTKITLSSILAVILIIIAFGAYYYLQQSSFQEIIAPYITPKRVSLRVFTPEQVLANKEKLLGRRITIEGVATPSSFLVNLKGFVHLSIKDVFFPTKSIYLVGDGYAEKYLVPYNREATSEEQMKRTGLYQGQPIGCAFLIGKADEYDCYPLHSGKQYHVIGQVVKEEISYERHPLRTEPPHRDTVYHFKIDDFKEVPLTPSPSPPAYRPIHIISTFPKEGARVTAINGQVMQSVAISMDLAVLGPLKSFNLYLDEIELTGKRQYRCITASPEIEEYMGFNLECASVLLPGSHAVKVFYEDKQGTPYEYEWTFEVVDLKL